MRSRALIRDTFLAALLLATPPMAAAQVYKWVDADGITNYSNQPPAKPDAPNGVAIVEDRVSVYTPEKAVIEEMRDARERRSAATRAGSYIRESEVYRRPSENTAAVAPAPAPAADPCLTGGNTACYGYPIYDGSPVFSGRHRPPRLVQPQLPPGAIAGNVSGGTGYTPGLSAQAPQAAAPAARARAPRGSFTLKDREERGDRGYRWR